MRDVVIIGGGLAGLVSANRLAQSGLSPLVLEKGKDEAYMCNSRVTGGALHVSFRQPKAPKEEIVAAIRRATADATSPALVEAVAADAPRLLAWLRNEGIRFIRGGHEEYKQWVLAPPRPQRAGLIWKGRGGDVLLRTLEANLLKQGGMLQRASRVSGLVRRDGGFTVRIDRAGRQDEIATRAVIFADGGFQADPELVRRHISPRPEALFQRNAATSCGDGLLLASELGAASVGLDRFYGHVLARDVFTNDRLWPFPWLDPLATHGLVVDANGNRFVDETRGGIIISNAIARLADPLSSIVILDDAIWSGAGKEGAVPPNPNLALAGATIYRAMSLPELALQIGLPAGSLEGAVAQVKDAPAAVPAHPAPPRGAGHAFLERPPFRAIRAAAGITYTMGGIAIDGDARVLDKAGRPLSGLYAAGSTTGGLEGGPSNGYVGGLVKAGVTGLRAAEHLARVLAARGPSDAAATP